MDNNEIIVIEDRLYKQNSVVVEFVTPEDGMGYNHVVVSDGARKFADVLCRGVTTGFTTALVKELRRRGYP